MVIGDATWLQLPRRGRIVWTDDDSQGSQPPPSGSYPWMASLFMLVPNSEEGVALFMCAGTVLTPNIIVTAAHCFTGNAESSGLATNSIVFCLLVGK